MRNFRIKRAQLATSLSLPPGLPWQYKVDGRLSITGQSKLCGRGIVNICLGDVEYADDT